MLKNLIAIMMGLVAAILAFLNNSPVIKIVAIIIGVILIAFIIMWIIGFIKDKKEEKNKKEQDP